MTGILFLGALIIFLAATYVVAYAVYYSYGATKAEAIFASLVITLLIFCSLALNMNKETKSSGDITPLLLFAKDCLIYILFPLVLIMFKEVDDRKKGMKKFTTNNQTDVPLNENISSLEFNDSNTNITINGIDGKHTKVDIYKSKLIITIK
jgi:hypothetical protein